MLLPHGADWRPERAGHVQPAALPLALLPGGAGRRLVAAHGGRRAARLRAFDHQGPGEGAARPPLSLLPWPALRLCLPPPVAPPRLPQVHDVFESVLDYPKFSVRVKEADVERVPEVLLAVTPTQLASMQQHLARVWQR